MKKVLVAAIFALILPFGVKASGTLVKSPSYSAVYYLGDDGKRYVFPNENVYSSWYGDFSGVTTITDSELYASPIGGNVTYKPGSKMVKITTDPKVYAVDKNGTLRWIVGEDVATQLYGSDWATKVSDIPDAFFVNYRVGSPISQVSDFSPSARMTEVASISQDKALGGLGAISDVPTQTQPVLTPVEAQNEAPAVVSGPKIVSFTSDKTTVKPGESFTLAWQAQDATACIITTNPNSVQIPFIGNLPTGDVAYSATGVYTLICADHNWKTVQQSVTIRSFVDTTTLVFTQAPTVTLTRTRTGGYVPTLQYQTNKPSKIATDNDGCGTGSAVRTTYTCDFKVVDEWGNRAVQAITYTTGPGGIEARTYSLSNRLNTGSTSKFGVMMTNNDSREVNWSSVAIQVIGNNIESLPGAKVQIWDGASVFFENDLQINASSGVVTLTGPMGYRVLPVGQRVDYTVSISGIKTTNTGSTLSVLIKDFVFSDGVTLDQNQIDTNTISSD